MLSYLKVVLLSASLGLVLSCAGVRFKPMTPTSPIVRVGILVEQEQISFEPKGRFHLISEKPGEKYDLSEKGVWQASVLSSSPAQQVYRVLLFESPSLESAQKQLSQTLQKNVQAELSTTGEALMSGKNAIVDRRFHRVLLAKNFDTETEAELYLKTSPDISSGRLITEMVKPAHGQIKLLSPSGREQSLQDAIRLSGSLISLKQVDVGTGYQWARQESRTYRGEMELRIDAAGKLTAINVLSLEEYLRGVLAAEMSATFPEEALMAQAVAARTFFIYNFGRLHRTETFDVCDDVHCQAYSGIEKESERITHAVNATRGLVLMHNDALCITPFNAVCGGHGESAENVWDSDGMPYLQGEFDLDAPEIQTGSFDLAKEEKIRTWIASQPKVYCNSVLMGNPDFAAYTTSYFRWEYKIPRSELEQLLIEKTGHQIGSLVDIVPRKRGPSGRLMDVEIIGTQDSVAVRKELNIRRAFCKTTLNSACFVVDKSGGSGGLADEFIFRGAGWGHGVGMCQTGAAIMALQGKSFANILGHYYRGAKLQQLY